MRPVALKPSEEPVQPRVDAMLCSVKRTLVALWVLGVVTLVFWLVKFMDRPPHRHVLPDQHQLSATEYWRLGLPTTTTTAAYRPTQFVPQIHLKLLPRIQVTETQTPAQAEENFFRFLENKDVQCMEDHRLGHQHDGGWNVCFSPPFSLQPPCLVYSFGIGFDWQFDDAVSKIYDCQVLSFDPSMNMSSHARSALVQFYNEGLGAHNMRTKQGWILRTLASHLARHGHQKTPVDYVKFDIEYMEWRVLQQIMKSGALKHVKQLGFEIHTRELPAIRNPRHPSTQADFLRWYRLLRELEDQNFRKFNYRLNPSVSGQYNSSITGRHRSCCYELHYVNLNLVSPEQIQHHTEDSPLFH